MFQQFDHLEIKVKSEKALVFKTSKDFLTKKICFSFITCLIGSVMTLSISFYSTEFKNLWGQSFDSISQLLMILGAICLFTGIYNTITCRYSIWFFDKEKQTLFLYIRKILVKIETEIPFNEIEGIMADKKEQKNIPSVYHAYLSTTKNNISFNTYHTLKECNEINDCIIKYMNSKENTPTN